MNEGTDRGGTSERLRRFQDHLRQREIRLALVFDPFNICYLSGYWTILSGLPGTDALLAVPDRGDPWLAVPGLELTLARELCPQIGDIRHGIPAGCAGDAGRREVKRAADRDVRVRAVRGLDMEVIDVR